MQPQFEDFLSHLRDTRKSPRTVDRYGDILRELSDFSTEPNLATFDATLLVRFSVRRLKNGQERSPAGVNLRVAVLKTAFAYLFGQGILPSNLATRLVGVREPRRPPKYLTTTEVERLLSHVASKKRNCGRNLAMVITFWQTGLRVSELARLTWFDLDIERRCFCDVLVKGGHVRDVPVNDEVLAALVAYRSSRTNVTDASPLFHSRKGVGLSVRAIQALFSTWRTELGWTRALHPHVLRHSHATGALALGTDIATVADLLGHQGLRSVTAYAAVQDDARRAALRKLGRLVPREILGRIGRVGAPANDTSEVTCAEEQFGAYSSTVRRSALIHLRLGHTPPGKGASARPAPRLHWCGPSDDMRDGLPGGVDAVYLLSCYRRSTRSIARFASTAPISSSRSTNS